MTDISRSLSDEDLNAYIDGEMSVEDMAATATFLTRDPQTLARVEVYRFQRAALQTLYARKLPSDTPDHFLTLLYGESEKSADPPVSGPKGVVNNADDPSLIPAEPSGNARSAPSRSQDEAEQTPARRRWRTAGGRYAIAATTAMLFLGASAVGGWVGHSRYIEDVYDQAQTQTFMNQAYSAYRLYSVGGESEAISEDQLRSVLTTLAENLGLTDDSDGPRFMPPLSRDTFRLVSSEVIPVAGRVGAIFNYVDDEGQKVSLYVQPNWDQRRRIQNAIQLEDIELQYRAEGMLAYALAAPAGLEGLPGLESWLSGSD